MEGGEKRRIREQSRKEDRHRIEIKSAEEAKKTVREIKWREMHTCSAESDF